MDSSHASSRSMDDGPILLAAIVAGATRALADRATPETKSLSRKARNGTVRRQNGGNRSSSTWYLHETTTLRKPFYRTGHSDRVPDPAKGPDGTMVARLPLIEYEYEGDSRLWTRLGELNVRDMLVMSVLSRAFYDRGCRQDNKVWGDDATLRHIARQVGMNPQASTRLIRASIARLATSKAVLRVAGTRLAPDGTDITTNGEMTIGFLANYGWREHCVKGKRVEKSNYIQLDQAMADLIRADSFTWLKASVLLKLRANPLALKLYAWARTHRPDHTGRILGYSSSKLAHILGCTDTNSTRQRRKMIAAMEAVTKAAPREFPTFDIRRGRTDIVLSLHRCVQPARQHGGPAHHPRSRMDLCDPTAPVQISTTGCPERVQTIATSIL